MMAQVHVVFSFCILQKLSLLVMEADCYYHDYIDRLHDGLSPEPEVTEQKCLCFWYWHTDGTWRKRQTDRLLGNKGPVIHTFLRHSDEMGPYLHVLRYLHFTDNKNEPDRMDRYFNSHTMALGLTQPVTEMSTRNISWWVKAAGANGC